MSACKYRSFTDRCLLTTESLPLASLPPTSKWPPEIIDQRCVSNQNLLLRLIRFNFPVASALVSFF